MYIKIFFAAAAACFLCGCFGPVLQVGDKIVPVKHHNGVPFITAPRSIYKELHYSTFGFDWNEDFLLPRLHNNKDRAFWVSKLTRADKLYSVVCTAEKERHYLQKPEVKILQQYLKNSYRQVPGSKIRITALKIESCRFKGLPAVHAYMETFESGRELYLREESYYFFDPLQPDTRLYQVRWSERGRQNDWRSPAAEALGRGFFKNFKLLPPEK